MGLSALAFAGVCQAGFLHPAYQGEFCAHNHKYTVDNDGEIRIQTKEYGNSANFLVNGMMPEKTWQTDIAFMDVQDLDNVIGDLTKLSKEIHRVQGEKGGPCSDSCK